MDANIARQRSQAYADLARAFSEAEPGLEREFTRLFLGPGRPVAHPYESVYREGRTMGDTTLDVRRRLTEEGLTQCLPGVGLKTAKEIIELRQSLPGERFTKLDQLQSIKRVDWDEVFATGSVYVE